MLFNFYNGLALIKYVILMQGSRSGFLEPGFFGFFLFFFFIWENFRFTKSRQKVSLCSTEISGIASL